MTKRKGLTVLLGCGLAALACAPAMGGTFYTSASEISTGNCSNTNTSNTGTTSANVAVGTPAPVACTGGNTDTIWGGANVSSLGILSATAEINGGLDSPITVTSTATLFDSLTFDCTGTCPGGTLTGDLLATITGAVLSQLFAGGTEYDSYTATITDTITSVVATGTGELCPTLTQSMNSSVMLMP